MARTTITAHRARRSGQLGVTVGVLVVAVLSLPEWSSAGAGGVVVGGRGSVALLAFVVADKEDLENGGDDEEEAMKGRKYAWLASSKSTGRSAG